jgi:uncharacterized membrane protein YedE/YeeE
VPGDTAWRALFLLGLVLAPLAHAAFKLLPAPHIDAGSATLLVAGLRVGIGTRYGGGCTSGHGVCEVLGFLDLAGHWDPSLLFVMGGATLVAGIGFGLAGFCPGPALASLGTGRGEPLLFSLAMIAGMALFELIEWLRAHGPTMA